MKRKIAFLSNYGDGADLGLRMALEDNVEVQLWIEDPRYRGNFDGVLDKAKSWQEAIKWSNLVVFDDNAMAHIWKQIKGMRPCFGGSEFSAKLEDDRKFCQDICKRSGLKVGIHKSFKTGKEVIGHLKDNPGAWVIKPEGKKTEPYHKIIGSKGYDNETIRQVDRLIKQGVVVENWEVEEKKEGVETAITRYFNGQEWLGPAILNWEHKHTGEGETGVLCGEAGTLVKCLEPEKNDFFERTLGLLTPMLRAANYRGVIDANFIVDDKGDPWLIELTPRPGKPISFIMEELRITSLSEIFYACALGEHLDIQFRWDWAVGVELFAHGFPFEKVTSLVSQGLPITEMGESLSHIHPNQMRRDKNGDWELGFGEGYVLTATGRGETIYDAKRRAYDAMRPIRLPGSTFRHDITDKINEYELKRLKILPETYDDPNIPMAPVALR